MMKTAKAHEEKSCCKSQQPNTSLFSDKSRPSARAEESSLPCGPCQLSQCSLIGLPFHARGQTGPGFGRAVQAQRDRAPAPAPVRLTSPVVQRYVKVGLYEGSFGLDHIGVGVNSEKTKGFSPKSGQRKEAERGSWVDGEVKEDHGLLDSLTIRTSPGQEARLQAAQNRSESLPQKFNLYDHNCAQHGAELLSSAGLGVRSSPQPRVFFEGLKRKYEAGQDESVAGGQILQGRFEPSATAAGPEHAEPRPNLTGMPDRLKAGIESLSGIDMSDVRVHASSDRPARLDALAYTQRSEIHLGPGQERHLAHEAWHVVQQKQGRVRATAEVKGLPLNDSSSLESEADLMGPKALQTYSQFDISKATSGRTLTNSVALEKAISRQNTGFIDCLSENKIRQVYQLMADEEIENLNPETEVQGFGGEITEKEYLSITEGCDRVRGFFKKNSDKLKFLHIGVGVGNPMNHFGANPSGPGEERILKNQVDPGFLTEAHDKGFAVANVIFNNLDSGYVESDSFIKIIVNARFPLTPQGEFNIKAFEQIGKLKNEANKFTIMNSVTQNHYANILNLAKDPNRNRGKSRYLTSYTEAPEKDRIRTNVYKDQWTVKKYGSNGITWADLGF